MLPSICFSISYRWIVDLRQKNTVIKLTSYFLRSTIERLFGEQYEQRKLALQQDPLSQQKLTEFNNKMNEVKTVYGRAQVLGRRNRIGGNRITFIAGIGGAFAAFLVNMKLNDILT